MAAPVITWYNTANIAAVSSWAIGIVDAGTESDELEVLIWNNRGGVTPVSDMQNVVITTKDSTGANAGDLVLDTWVQVKVNSLGESTFTAVGGTVTKAASTILQTENTDVGSPWTPNVAPHDTISPSTVDILGVINDGALWTANTPGNIHAGGNYIHITLKASVPSDASAGTISFKTRCAYQYI